MKEVLVHALKAANKKYKLGLGDLGVIKALKNSATDNKCLSLCDLAKSEHLLANYERLGIKAISFFSEDYPEALKKLPNPPAIIYAYGSLDLLKDLDKKKRAISIVGARRASLYAKRSTRALVESLKGYETIIVSGLATGIDSEAHMTALKNNLPTIAVLGGGLLKVKSYRDNDYVFNALVKDSKGLIISEFEPNESPAAWTFAQRNRIIAALSQATIVIEAAAKSGSLITADFAMRLKKEVYALSGELDNSKFLGSHALIAEGKAKALYSVKQLESDLELRKVNSNKSYLESSGQAARNETYRSNPRNHNYQNQDYKNLDTVARKILNSLKLEALSLEKLAGILGLDIASLLSSIAILEIKGLVSKSGHKIKLISN